MNKASLINLLKFKKFKKLTGPAEHWLTTFNTCYWGLNRDREREWNKIRVGDLFVFHSSKIEYLDSRKKLPTGIIGMGIVGGKSEKDSLQWIGEIKSNENKWPFLIHFSEIWWFGDINDIENVSIKKKIAKGEELIIKDLEKLTSNLITFEEMRQNDCLIPAQGSIATISDNNVEPLVRLLVSRIQGNPIEGNEFSEDFEGTEEEEVIEVSSEEDLIKSIARNARNLKDINLDETNEEARQRETKFVTYEKNMELQDRANELHRNTLKILANYLKKRNLVPKESNIDLLTEKNEAVFIFEIKSIHSKNFKSQTRRAIGQLLEYEYFQVRNNRRYQNKKILRGIVYSRKPPEEIINFLKTYSFYAFWIEDNHIKSDEHSNNAIESFISGKTN